MIAMTSIALKSHFITYGLTTESHKNTQGVKNATPDGSR